jgi:hypothetical protein
MRLPVIALATLLAAPAFAQEVRLPQAPPPEGFYRNINGVYDLLARPYAFSEIQMVKARRLPQLLEQRTQPLATPLPPPCEPPPVASGPASKPTRPAPCPAPR